MTRIDEAPDTTLRTGNVSSPTVWPYAIGAISIALGVGGVLGMVRTVLSLGPLLFTEHGWDPSTLEFCLYSPIWVISRLLLPVFHGLATSLLLIAGIKCWRRRPSTRALHIIYAVGIVAVSTVTPYSTYLSYSTGIRFPSHLVMQVVIQSGIDSLIDLAFPIFYLVWFLRPVVSQEIRTWKQAQPPALGQ